MFSRVLFGGPVAKVQGQPPRERGGSVPNVRVVLVLTVTNFTSILVYQVSTLQRLRRWRLVVLGNKGSCRSAGVVDGEFESILWVGASHVILDNLSYYSFIHFMFTAELISVEYVLSGHRVIVGRSGITNFMEVSLEYFVEVCVGITIINHCLLQFLCF